MGSSFFGMNKPGNSSNRSNRSNRSNSPIALPGSKYDDNNNNNNAAELAKIATLRQDGKRFRKAMSG
jgi:hypothetical protein